MTTWKVVKHYIEVCKISQKIHLKLLLQNGMESFVLHLLACVYTYVFEDVHVCVSRRDLYVCDWLFGIICMQGVYVYECVCMQRKCMVPALLCVFMRVCVSSSVCVCQWVAGWFYVFTVEVEVTTQAAAVKLPCKITKSSLCKTPLHTCQTSLVCICVFVCVCVLSSFTCEVSANVCSLAGSLKTQKP